MNSYLRFPRLMKSHGSARNNTTFILVIILYPSLYLEQNYFSLINICVQIEACLASRMSLKIYEVVLQSKFGSFFFPETQYIS